MEHTHAWRLDLHDLCRADEVEVRVGLQPIRAARSRSPGSARPGRRRHSGTRRPRVRRDGGSSGWLRVVDEARSAEVRVVRAEPLDQGPQCPASGGLSAQPGKNGRNRRTVARGEGRAPSECPAKVAQQARMGARPVVADEDRRASVGYGHGDGEALCRSPSRPTSRSRRSARSGSAAGQRPGSTFQLAACMERLARRVCRSSGRRTLHGIALSSTQRSPDQRSTFQSARPGLIGLGQQADGSGSGRHTVNALSDVSAFGNVDGRQQLARRGGRA